MENCLNPIAVNQQIKVYSSPVKTPQKNGTYKVQRPYKLEDQKFVVPCGKCPLCLHSHRMNWLMRCQQESKFSQSPNHWFLTLTYNEKKVPRRHGVRTLYKRHPQLFFKRLRKAGYQIKYILVGEYGSDTSRPHYHMLCWTNAPYTAIDQAWNYGFVHYRMLERETILYTLKYVLNPRQGDNLRKQSEYAVYSKGIGLSYITPQMFDYHAGDYARPMFTTVLNGQEIPLPRYYRKKIFTKYQNRLHAEQQYYRALKDKWRMIKQLKKWLYPNPSMKYRELKHNRARQIVNQTNKKGKL